MAIRTRLFERLLDRGGGGIRRQGGDPDAVIASVTESLRRILNSGRGEATTDGRYGLPDLRGLVRNMPRSTNDMLEAIRETIERYEPRLKRVRVKNTTDADSSRLHFEITAELNDDEGDERQPIKFN